MGGMCVKNIGLNESFKNIYSLMGFCVMVICFYCYKILSAESYLILQNKSHAKIAVDFHVGMV